MAIDESERRSKEQLKQLITRGPDRGYLPDPSKSLFISDNTEDYEGMRWDFDWAGLNPDYIGGSRYLRSYLRPREDLEAWVHPKVEAWYHMVRTLAKMTK